MNYVHGVEAQHCKYAQSPQTDLGTQCNHNKKYQTVFAAFCFSIWERQAEYQQTNFKFYIEIQKT